MAQPDAAPEPLPGCILFVEDDPLVRFPIAEALRDLGISVVEAATADEAWEHLRVAASAVDLVFTDYNMPGSMTGEELASRIGQQYPGMATVITSGGSGGPLDPSRFLGKPYDLFQTANAFAAGVRRQGGEPRGGGLRGWPCHHEAIRASACARRNPPISCAAAPTQISSLTCVSGVPRDRRLVGLVHCVFRSKQVRPFLFWQVFGIRSTLPNWCGASGARSFPASVLLQQRSGRVRHP
jgi:CheY-like chemotaxis protein